MLQPADGEWAADLYPQSYRPAGAEVTHNGVTLRVVEVAHTADVTAIRTQVDWDDPAWQHFGLSGGRYLPFLRDDLGHTYQETHENSGSVAVACVVEEPSSASMSDPTLHEETYTYVPISPAARELTLMVDALDFNVPADDAFTIDLGSNPQVGDIFPLDVTLDVAGFPVHLTEAQLVEVEEGYHPDHMEKEVHLTLAIAPVADTGQRGLRGIDFDADDFSGSSGGYHYDTNQLRAALTLAEDASLPPGAVRVQVTRASIWLMGPWEVNWTAPAGTTESGMQPRTLYPDAAVTLDDVTVSVAEVTLTDRVTAVQFSVESSSGGGEVFPYPHLAWTEPALYLEDNRGHQYEPADWTVQWQPGDFQPGEDGDPNRVMFTPLDSLARRVMVNVPAVIVDVVETAVLEVTIPEYATLQPDENPMLLLRSQTWPINVPISIAGYDLVFTEAWLREINSGQVLLNLETAELSQPENGSIGDAQGRRWLRELHIGQVTGPVGLLPASEWTLGSAGLFYPPGTERIISSDGSATNELEPPRIYRAGLSIDLDDGGFSGAYRIEISGAGVQIAGPWRISVDLP